MLPPHGANKYFLIISPGVGASKEDKVLFLEGEPTQEEMIMTLARHIVDGELGEAFFNNQFALQRDILADAAAEHIKFLLPDIH